MSEQPPSWAERLAYAVTGERLAGPEEGGEESVAAAAALLAAHGWDAERVLAHADARRAAAEPWPHPLPADWLPRGTHARFAAQREALVQAVGGRRQREPGPGSAPDARDRELQADRPPHW